MISVTTFDSTAESLLDLLQGLKSGHTQLPDFQRGWLWEDERVRKLLVSVSRSWPIGAIMFLQTGSEGITFQPKAIHGVKLNEGVKPERLILDGQQRLTALFQPLFTDKLVDTYDDRGRAIKRQYYIDIEKALDPDVDQEEAIISVPEDGFIKGAGNKVLADYSTREKEWEAGVMPLHLIFDPAKQIDWQNNYLFYDPENTQKRFSLWQKLVQDILPRFLNYQIPVIMLRKDVPKEAVCQVFENVNTGGVSLTIFELLTASFSAEGFQLREDWKEREEILENEPVLSEVSETNFLQTIALLVSYNRKKNRPAAAVSCKRKDILGLNVDDYKKWADKALLDGYIEAAKFLQEQKIFLAKDLPYGTQLVPLSAILVELGDLKNNLTVRKKIARWFWCGVLGELYGSAVETHFARDLPEVISWVNGGHEPTTVTEAEFHPDRLLTLRTRNSAAYKGIHALLMRDGGRDFLSGVTMDITTYFGENVDIHHIFPRQYCKEVGIDSGRYDSIVNKTPLTYKTNRIIGGNPPSVYLDKLENEKNIDFESLDNNLSTHVIDPTKARSDDFDSFFELRKKELLRRIENAMNH